MSPSSLRLAYYADDFTGATDALESVAQAGLKTRLFLNPPTAAQCAGLDAVGVAGFTRSLAPAPMEAVLRPAFAALRALGPRHVHYKICSTFDSSPTVGSIGRATNETCCSFVDCQGGDFACYDYQAPVSCTLDCAGFVDEATNDGGCLNRGPVLVRAKIIPLIKHIKTGKPSAQVSSDVIKINNVLKVYIGTLVSDAGDASK